MASPVADSYSVASGAALWVGRYPPGSMHGSIVLGEVSATGDIGNNLSQASGAAMLGDTEAGGSLDGYALPAWRQGMVPWEWRELPGTASLSGVMPTDALALRALPAALGGYGTRMNAWNGFAFVGKCVYLAAAGGHADWPGNAVYKIDLSTPAPVWTLQKDSTLAVDVIEASPYYADGKPSSAHLYKTLHGVRGQIIRTMATWVYGVGTSHNAVDAFDIATNEWLPAGSYPVNPEITNGGPVCIDPRDDFLYYAGNTKVWKRDPVTGVWTGLASIPNAGSAIASSIAVVDTDRNTIIYMHDQYNIGSAFIYDITANTFTRLVPSGAAVSEMVGKTEGHGWYLPAENAVIAKSKFTDRVGRIDTVNLNCEFQATTGGTGMADAVNGVQTRFARIDPLGGFFYQPSYASNAWFLATE